MYVKTKCTQCGQYDYHNIRLHVSEDLLRNGSKKLTVHDAEVVDSVSEEELACVVLHELQGYVYNGITTRELCKVLERQFGVVARYCCDVIQRLKIELDMYCPDHQHLYFVEA